MQSMPAIDLATLLHFSHQNCIAICAFLVPANLLATGQTLLLFFLNRPAARVRLSALLASSFAVLMILHVLSWFAIGVVTPVTFILSSLAATCLLMNICTAAIAQRSRKEIASVAPNFSSFVIMKIRGAVMVSTGWRKPICDTGRE